MSDENRHSDEDRRKNSDFKMPSRNWIVWILIFMCVILVVLFRNQYPQEGETITQSKFLQLVDAKRIDSAKIKFNAQSPFSKDVVGKYYDVDKDGKKVGQPKEFHTKVYLT